MIDLACKKTDISKPDKTVGIVGLGLIGGSLAKAIRNKLDCRLLGCDIRDDSLDAALDDGVIDGELTDNGLAECSLVIVCLYPDDVISYCKNNIRHMKKGSVLVDCAGVKTRICEEVSELAKEYGIKFVGGHPMAGIERSGYENSFAELFNGATMILCKDNVENTADNAVDDTETPDDLSDGSYDKILNELCLFFTSVGFGSIKVTTAKEHDEIIAYTSQLAHIVSSAYIRSDVVDRRYGFSAGSFKDLTRVARLDEDMWTELFFENRDNLLEECDIFLSNIRLYRNALAAKDMSEMKKLLRDSDEMKIIDDDKETEWLKQ